MGWGNLAHRKAEEPSVVVCLIGAGSIESKGVCVCGIGINGRRPTVAIETCISQ